MMSHKWSCICAACEAERGADRVNPARVVAVDISFKKDRTETTIYSTVVAKPALVSDAATARLGDLSFKTPRWFEALRDPAPAGGDFHTKFANAKRGDAVMEAAAFVELVEAARAVVRSWELGGSHASTGLTDDIKRLRRALP